MEYLVRMTTHVPEGTTDETVEEIRVGRLSIRASSQHKGICFVFGVPRFSRGSGGHSGSSPLTTKMNSIAFSPPCLCISGAYRRGHTPHASPERSGADAVIH